MEEAVRRETWEETGIEVGEVVYHSSQPWPGMNFAKCIFLICSHLTLYLTLYECIILNIMAFCLVYYPFHSLFTIHLHFKYITPRF